VFVKFLGSFARPLGCVFIGVGCFGVFGCGDTAETAVSSANGLDTSTNRIIPKDTLPVDNRRFLVTNAANIRIRQTPDLQGVVVEVLPAINMILEYLNDSTQFMSEVSFQNQQLVGHWYKCRTSKGNEGWVFGGLAGFVSDAENQKILSQIRANTIHPNNPNQANIQHLSPKNKDTKVDEVKTQAYYQYLQRLNTQQYYSVSSALAEFRLQFEDATGASCDKAFVDFRNFFQKVEASLQSKHNFGAYASKAEELKTYGRAYTGQDSFLYKLSENGFVLVLVDGQVGIGEDTDFILRTFYRYVSPAMRDYLNQLHTESETYWIESQKVLISPEKLADWAGFWLNFSDKYPNFLLHIESRQRGIAFLRYLVYGNTLSPVFDKQKKLLPAYKQAYEKLKTTYAGSAFGEKFAQYVQTLAENGDYYDNSIEQAARVLFQ
jgi:hypothetical protein